MTSDTLKAHRYLEKTRQPLYSLIFILPMLLTYEIGVRIINSGTDWPRVNGADALIKSALQHLDFYGSLLSAVIIICTLLFLHVHSHNSWVMQLRSLLAMYAETAVLALPLFPLGAAVRAVTMQPESGTFMASALAGEGIGTQIIYMLGAGVYEEFLFRLVMMGLLLIVVKKICGHIGSRHHMLILLISAVSFAIIHHIGSESDNFSLYYFGFRTLAGVYFGWLYLVRGYGICAGTHAWYNLFVVFLNQINGLPQEN